MAYDFGFTGEDVTKEVAAIDPRCLLAFSTGKDCIAAYIAIRDHFEEIVPFYMYQIPGTLEFIEESLAYYERTIFKRHIIRVPHPFLPRAINDMVFQPPERITAIMELELVNHSKDDANDAIKQELGLPPETFTALGVRSADSPQRFMYFKKYGAINHKHRKFYPVFDWKKERMLTEIAASGIKLPIDYRLFGKTFDGVDLRFLYPIKKHFPRDYQKILEWFPMAELEMFRYETRAQK